MSVVYLAKQASMERYAAVKIVAATDPDAASLQKRFRQEVRAASRLVHPNIVIVFNFGELPDGSLFLAMEYIEGAPLSAVLARGPVPVQRALELAIQCTEALGYAHSRNVVHRDFKPDNVMLTEVLGRDHVKVVDFGLARLIGAETQTRTLAGTPRYMSPEQCRGEETGGASDQYSLGLVLYEMLTGKVAVEADTYLGYLHKHVNEPIVPVSRHAPALVSLDPIIARMVAKNPGRRFPSMQEVGQALRRAVQQVAPTSHDERPLWRGAQPSAGVASQLARDTIQQTVALSKGNVLPVGEMVLADEDWKQLEQVGLGRASWDPKIAPESQIRPKFTLIGLGEAGWEPAWRHWVQAAISPAETLVCIDAPLTSSAVAHCTELIPNVAIGQFPLDWRLIAAVLAARINPEASPLQHMFPNRAVQVVQITSSRQKSASVDSVLEDARAEGMRQRGLQSLAELCEEMILNAIFHAPVNAEGGRRFADLPRSSEIALTDRDAPTLRWLSDDKYIGVSVRDPFGSLQAREVLARITGGKRQPSLDRANKGVGMGLWIMSRAANQLLFMIRPGVSCEVTALVPKDGKHATGPAVAVLQLSSNSASKAGDRLRLDQSKQHGVVRITLHGEINETSDLSPIFRNSGRVFLNLAGVSRINSVGIRAWLDAAETRSHDLDLIFEECSLAIVSQLNMVPAITETGRIASIMAPYLCPRCNTASMERLGAEDLMEELPPVRHCLQCNAQLEFDEMPEEYFAFLGS